MKHNPGGQCDLCEGQCLDQPVHPRPVGRPPGSGKGLRQGSRPHQIAQLKVGERLTFTVPAGKRVTSYMGQIGADIGRAGMRGRVKQQHGMFIIVATREVSDVVVVECVQ